MKICKRCGESKPLEMFNKDSRLRDGLNIYCKQCKKIELLAWRAKNAEHIALYRKTYNQENKDKKASWDARYRNKHSEHISNSKRSWYENNKAHVRAICRNWTENNRTKVRAGKAKYRAGKVNATPSWADKKLIQTVYDKAAEYGFQVDHIVPLRSDKVCGLHVWANLQLLEAGLNISKSNRHWPDMPEEVYE